MSLLDAACFNASDPETRLHRRVVEIRDAVVDSRVPFEMSDAERVVVEAVEKHLLGRGASADAPSAGATTRGTR
ncbi:DUF6545 domain-containing protein [Microbacterium sp. LWH3-1.2]|uniref:DUF6545 domain-containing protein n=1 Tax=Microbacterium sp. LWH3-1.2 TaxID=3135256 RepID=UPI00342251AC